MGANLTLKNKKMHAFEPTADINIQSSNLKNLEISRKIPFLIDEIPILAVASLFGESQFTVKNAQELRVKESDRIASIVNLVRSIGGKIKEFEDGFTIYPQAQFKDFAIDLD